MKNSGWIWRLLGAGMVSLLCLSAVPVWAKMTAVPQSPLRGRMPFYTGRILPTPQEVQYHDSLLDLRNVALLLGETVIDPQPLVAFLRARIESIGGSLTRVERIPEQGSCIIIGGCAQIGGILEDLPMPDRAQAYCIDFRKVGSAQVMVLRGRDRLGLVWAMSSINQLLDTRDGHPVLHAADVRDFPEVKNRGFIASRWSDGAYFAVTFKFNKPVFQGGLEFPGISRSQRPGAWRRPIPAELAASIHAIGAFLTPLGIEWYAGFNPIVGKPEEKIRSANDDDFHALLERARLVADAGGNLCLKYDDHRFPIHPEDMKRFGSAREADIFLINRLLAAVRKTYPRFRILFCPPFYWGPISRTKYPESRDEYLFAIGERLPDGVEIFWTGPQVKSAYLSPEHVIWITERLKRKPVYWQNRFGMPHPYGYHYFTDPIATWKEWYYDGFLHEVDSVMLNSLMPHYCAANATLADYCWNPKNYDPDSSISEACIKLVGADAYQKLKRLNQALSWFDVFGLRRSPAVARRLPEMEKHLAAVNQIWGDVKTLNFQDIQRWTGMGAHVQQVNKFVEKLKRNPETAACAAPVKAARLLAEKEAGVQVGRDIFLSPVDFVGGAAPAVYGNRCEKRFATWIYGSRSMNPAMGADFEVDPFPPSGDYELIVSGQDDDAEASCRIRIKVNDMVIFEGGNPFVRLGWSRHIFHIPASSLKPDNTLTIENIESTSRTGGPPFFMLNYAVLRKTAE